MIKVILPELGEGIEKATVACWHVAVGQKVNEGDDVAEVVTDKATFNIAAPAEGTVQEILFREGQDAAVGAALAIIA